MDPNKAKLREESSGKISGGNSPLGDDEPVASSLGKSVAMGIEGIAPQRVKRGE